MTLHSGTGSAWAAAERNPISNSGSTSVSTQVSDSGSIYTSHYLLGGGGRHLHLKDLQVRG